MVPYSNLIPDNVILGEYAESLSGKLGRADLAHLIEDASVSERQQDPRATAVGAVWLRLLLHESWPRCLASPRSVRSLQLPLRRWSTADGRVSEPVCLCVGEVMRHLTKLRVCVLRLCV